ncbi:transposase family protein [Synechococcus sp. Lug-A]|nr:transposase family protein [Synechococcus sp. Lug-A]
MRHGVRIPAWYLLLVAVLGILSGCESLRDLERFARRHHSVLGEQLGLELRRPPSDSAFRYFFLQVDVVALCAANRDWTIAQIPGGATELGQLICVALGLPRSGWQDTAGFDRAHRWRWFGVHCPGDAVFCRPGCGDLPCLLRHR